MIVTESAMESAFSKPWGHSYKHESFTESVSKVSDLSYKHERFTKNDSDEVCARVCFW